MKWIFSIVVKPLSLVSARIFLILLLALTMGSLYMGLFRFNQGLEDGYIYYSVVAVLGICVGLGIRWFFRNFLKLIQILLIPTILVIVFGVISIFANDASFINYKILGDYTNAIIGFRVWDLSILNYKWMLPANILFSSFIAVIANFAWRSKKSPQSFRKTSIPNMVSGSIQRIFSPLKRAKSRYVPVSGSARSSVTPSQTRNIKRAGLSKPKRRSTTPKVRNRPPSRSLSTRSGQLKNRTRPKNGSRPVKPLSNTRNQYSLSHIRLSVNHLLNLASSGSKNHIQNKSRIKKSSKPSLKIRPNTRQSKLSVRSKSANKRLRSRKKQAPIQLVGEEERICPFCFEDVQKNDPRGIEKCSICGTHHHADCWDVAGGVCQVPHNQPL